MLLVLTGFSEIFTVGAPNWRCDDKQEKQAKKDYYEPSDSVLQIGYLLGSKRVQGEFHRKSSKMWLWSRAPNNMKAKISRRVNEFWKFAIFLVVMALSENEASDIVLQIGHLLGSNAVQREFHTNSYKVSLTR